MKQTAIRHPAMQPGEPAHQALQALRLAFTVIPITAGLDKFFHALVNWDLYLAPSIAARLPMDGHTFLLMAGAIEIVAGLVVAVQPRIGGYLVAGWLWAIIVNLLLVPGFLDVALRDFGLSLAALALARLAEQQHREELMWMLTDVDELEEDEAYTVRSPRLPVQHSPV